MDSQSVEADKQHLGRAVSLALHNIRSGGGGPFGAVVTRAGTVIAEGCNEVVPGCDPTAHAEVVAIRRAAQALGRPHLDDCVLYASCEPCPMCLASAYWARIPRVVFALTRDDAAAMGFSDAEIYKEVSLPATQRAMRCEHRRPAEADMIQVEWNAKADRRQY